MKVLYKIISRILLLTVVVFLCNFAYRKTLWKEDLKTTGAELLEQIIHAQDSADVIYFAESSNWSTHEKDTIKKSISEFTSEYYPGLVFRSVQKGAIHAGVYVPLIKRIRKGARVKTIVVTLNLRSFNANWIHSKLETPLMRANLAYEQRPAVLSRFLMSLNAYDNRSEKQRDEDLMEQWRKDQLMFPYPFQYSSIIEWDRAMGNGTYLKTDGTWDMPKIELACSYVKTYAFQIDTLTNPRIKDFDRIVKICKEKNLNLVFNLMAENVQYADSLVGKDLVYLIHQNRDLLMARYNKDDVTVVDNLELVDGKLYIDQNWTTEHYMQVGRQTIANNLAEHLRKIYPEKYSPLVVIKTNSKLP
ncbi:MAG: hypothetical protein M3R27_04775 [Bacteroidota bacterium]|nr:hypothetical protein [Bacteroidota bacterium]